MVRILCYIFQNIKQHNGALMPTKIKYHTSIHHVTMTFTFHNALMNEIVFETNEIIMELTN